MVMQPGAAKRVFCNKWNNFILHYETQTFTFSRKVLIFTNTASFHVKNHNFHGKSHNIHGKSLNFRGFYTNFHGMYLKSRLFSKMSKFKSLVWNNFSSTNTYKLHGCNFVVLASICIHIGY